jgi:hypothetical protein
MKMYPQGRMSHHFREMKVGGYLSVKGPKVCLYSAITCLQLLLVPCPNVYMLVQHFLTDSSFNLFSIQLFLSQPIH